MSTENQIYILFFIAVFLYNYHKECRAGENAEELYDHLSTDLKKALTQILSSWTHDSLEKALYDGVQEFPADEEILSQAYKKQRGLLYRATQADSEVKMMLRLAIEKALAACKTVNAVQKLHEEFDEVLRHYPDLNDLFELCIKKLQPPKRKQLFEMCESIEEIKRRFRKLALHNHPDRGGTKAAMQEILRQYEEALQEKGA